MDGAPVTYADVEVLAHEAVGFTCAIADRVLFVGRDLALAGTTVAATGDRGRLTLPQWFAEQMGLPIPAAVDDDATLPWLDPARQEEHRRANEEFARALMARVARLRG